jgi:hypothetical protein
VRLQGLEGLQECFGQPPVAFVCLLVNYRTQILTLSIRHVLDHISILDNFDNAAHQSLSTLGGVIDCDERVWPFGGCRRHIECCLDSADLVMTGKDYLAVFLR